MKTTNKYLALATAAAVMLPAAMVSAASTNIDATANFLAAITLGNEVDMDFATIETSGAAAGATASLGTDGNITYGGNFGGAGTGTAGSVEITAGTTGQVIQVQCDASAVLSDGTETIDVNTIEVIDAGNAGASGTGNDCQGIGSSAMTYTLTGTDVLKFGGILDGDTASAATPTGAYSTATAGGTNIQIDVIYN